MRERKQGAPKLSGHSKWATIKHQKGVADAKRGQVFTKVAREITVAARQGGANPDMNMRLRLAMQKARENNMPMENVERAIKRGAGASDDAGEGLYEVTYEGYGPGGTAILLQVLTDNRNRTISEVRNVFTRAGCNMGQTGSVSWIFEHKGVIALETEPAKAEELALVAIDAGADDFKIDGSYLEIYCSPENLDPLSKAMEAHGAKVASAELSMVPKTTVPLDPQTAEQALKLLDHLEEQDDVQHVYSNAEFPNEVLEAYKSGA